MNVYSLLNYFKFRTIGLLLLYALLCGGSYFIAFQLRFDFHVPENFTTDMVHTIWWIVILKLTLLLAFGQVDCVLAYFRLSDALQLLVGLFLCNAFLVVLWYSYRGDGMPPRAVILTDFFLCFLLLAGFRIAMRIRASSDLNDWLNMDTVENVIIVGAGEVGASICSELKSKTRFGLLPVALLDDNTNKIGRYVHGVRIAGSINQLANVAKRYKAQKVIIAFPSASKRRIREVVEMAQSIQLPVDSVPAMTDLVSGRAKITQLHPIEMKE